MLPGNAGTTWHPWCNRAIAYPSSLTTNGSKILARDSMINTIKGNEDDTEIVSSRGLPIDIATLVHRTCVDPCPLVVRINIRITIMGY